MTNAEIDALIDRMLNHIASNVNSYEDFKELLDGARHRDDLRLIVRKHLDRSEAHLPPPCE